MGERSHLSIFLALMATQRADGSIRLLKRGSFFQQCSVEKYLEGSCIEPVYRWEKYCRDLESGYCWSRLCLVFYNACLPASLVENQLHNLAFDIAETDNDLRDSLIGFPASVGFSSVGPICFITLSCVEFDLNSLRYSDSNLILATGLQFRIKFFVVAIAVLYMYLTHTPVLFSNVKSDETISRK